MKTANVTAALLRNETATYHTNRYNEIRNTHRDWISERYHQIIERCLANARQGMSTATVEFGYVQFPELNNSSERDVLCTILKDRLEARGFSVRYYTTRNNTFEISWELNNIQHR